MNHTKAEHLQELENTSYTATWDGYSVEGLSPLASSHAELAALRSGYGRASREIIKEGGSPPPWRAGAS